MMNPSASARAVSSGTISGRNGSEGRTSARFCSSIFFSLKERLSRISSLFALNVIPRINAKTAYVVDFETEELIRKAINSLDKHLHVSKIYYKVQTGEMKEIKSKDALTNGE